MMTTNDSNTMARRHAVSPRQENTPIFDCPIEKLEFHTEKFDNHDDDSSAIQDICDTPVGATVATILQPLRG